MATIGHTLVGLSIGGLCPERPRSRKLPVFWLGLMVLAAHFVDIAEWLITLWAPSRYSQHLVTHSPFWTAVLVVVLWAVLAAARIRSPWPYLCIALAVFSHLLLDYLPARVLLVNLYGRADRDALPRLRESIIAEIWLYGLLLVLIVLYQAAWQPNCPRKARTLAVMLALICIVAALLRMAAVWAPTYALAMGHSLLLLRRRISTKLLWSLVPLIPLATLLTLELWSVLVYRKAIRLQQGGDYPGAARLHRQAIAVPTRSSKAGVYVYLSFCDRQAKDWAACEHDLQTAVRLSEDPAWAELTLAQFYLYEGLRGTSYYRPDEAQRILEKVINGRYRQVDKGHALRYMEQFRKAGILK